MAKSSSAPYVSRGGLKLAPALEKFSLQPQNRVCLDVGASTGGFTDCLLQQGGRKVYAVDVGYGQLAWKLRQDPRVVVIERQNARHWEGSQIEEPIDLVTFDLAFISLTLVIPNILRLIRRSRALPSPATSRPPTKGFHLVALIKPNFEVGKGRVGRGGVVRDPALHGEVCEKIRRHVEENGLEVAGLIDSPLLGPKGNREFFIHAREPQSLPQRDTTGSLPTSPQEC